MATASITEAGDRPREHSGRQEMTLGRHCHKNGSSPKGSTQPILPCASEQFGVYQPLIGWRSQLQHERLSDAIASRVLEASRVAGSLQLPADRPPALHPRLAVDRTGTVIGRAIASHANSAEGVDSTTFHHGNNASFSKLADNVLEKRSAIPRTSAARHARPAIRLDSATIPQPASGSVPAAEPQPVPGDTSQESNHEVVMTAVLKYLGNTQPSALQSLFRPAVAGIDRTIYGAGLLTHPSNSVFLSPIGILHLFREYFFEMGTFLGPPVGHVWVSPGGTLEVVESNTRRVTSELTTESSTTTTTKSESSTTEKNELSDAVKDENANNTNSA